MSALYRLMEKIKKQNPEKMEECFNWDRRKFVNLLIGYLNERLHCQYYYSVIEDIDGNSADALVLENSQLFAKHVEGHEMLKFNVEQLIDNRYTDNDGEIILLDLNGKVKEINITYLIETLESTNISYSRRIRKNIELLLDYLIKKTLHA